MGSGALGLGAAILLGASQLVYLAAMGTLGLRLLARARRSRTLPEALLAAHFLLCCTLGYVVLGGGLAAARAQRLPPEVVPFVVGAGHLLSGAGVLAGVAFTAAVFRRGSRAARALVVAFGAALAGGWLAGVATGGFGADTGSFTYRFLYAAYGAAAVWVMVEPLRYWRAMRRRLALGLADPLLANRFLLWGIGSAFRLGMLAVGSLALVVPPDDLAASALVLGAAALLGLGVVVAYWLTFFPTAGYIRLAVGRSPTAR